MELIYLLSDRTYMLPTYALTLLRIQLELPQERDNYLAAAI